MPINDAVSLVIIKSIFNGVQGLFIVRFSLNAPNLGRFLVPALLGIGVRFAVLDWVNILFLKMTVATPLVLFECISPSGDTSIITPAPFACRYLNRVRRGRSGRHRAVWRPPKMWCACMTGPTADNALLSSPLSADPHHCSGIDDLAEPHERQHSLAHPANDSHLDHQNAGGAPSLRRLLNRFFTKP